MADQQLQHTQRGTTLTEVLMVVAIIAILASIAIPLMRKTVERSYRQTAEHLLWTIHDGEQQYFDKEKEYKVNLASLPDWRAIFMDDPHHTAKIPVSYMVETDPTDPTGFLATATCTGCSLGCSPVCSMTIDATGLLDTANWPLP